MSQLTTACLIRRGRRFGSASLTFITAYDQLTDLHEQPVASASLTKDLAPRASSHDGTAEPSKEGADARLPSIQTTLDKSASADKASPESSFFGHKSEPSISSFSRRHTIKSHHVKTGGCGDPEADQTKNPVDESGEASRRLQAEGVADDAVIQELLGYPSSEVERVIHYVARCRSKDDPRRPGLIVHLVRHNFGKYCHSSRDGRQGTMPLNQTGGGTRQPSRTADDSHRYVSDAFCCHGISGPCPYCNASMVIMLPTSDSGSLPNQDAISQAPCNDVEVTWKAILARLAETMTAADVSTWLKQTCLLDITSERAVVGTSNVFVRDHVQEVYSAPLSAALAAELGHPIQVEIVIDSPAHV
jgi:hypothetical protein